MKLSFRSVFCKPLIPNDGSEVVCTLLVENTRCYDFITGQVVEIDSFDYLILQTLDEPGTVTLAGNTIPVHARKIVPLDYIKMRLEKLHNGGNNVGQENGSSQCDQSGNKDRMD